MQNQFLPINNNFSPIDLRSVLSTNNRVLVAELARRRPDYSALRDILKYSDTLLKSAASKKSIILDTKQILDTNTRHKTSYFAKVDMLRPLPISEKHQTRIQKYLRSFTSLDIELSKNTNTVYEFNPRTLNVKLLHKNVYKILESAFFEMSCLISRPSFYVSPTAVCINLFYFVCNTNKDNQFLDLNSLKLEGLSAKLSNYFKKPVKLELSQIYSVSNNAEILCKILGKLALVRRNSFSRIVGRFLKYQSKKIFFRKTQINSNKLYTFLTGVNIKLGGRLMRGKIIPRRSKNKIQYGSLARSKSNYQTTARISHLNKRGVFSFTVSMGHKFF